MAVPKVLFAQGSIWNRFHAVILREVAWRNMIGACRVSCVFPDALPIHAYHPPVVADCERNSDEDTVVLENEDWPSRALP